jgi:hypothetical protein
MFLLAMAWAMRATRGRSGRSAASLYRSRDRVLRGDMTRHGRLPSRRHQSEARMNEPSSLKRWPDVPTRALMCRDDRLFPVDWLRRVIAERLRIAPNEIDGGHYVALSRPKGLAGGLPGLIS